MIEQAIIELIWVAAMRARRRIPTADINPLFQWLTSSTRTPPTDWTFLAMSIDLHEMFASSVARILRRAGR